MAEEITKSDFKSFLPIIYQEEAEKGDSPLGALVNIFEDTFQKIETQIDKIDTYFDPSETPIKNDREGRDFLSWLSSWVDLILDERWSEDKKRYLIKNIVQLYRNRGTIEGFRYMINQFFDIDIEVKEWSWPNGMIIGQYSTIGEDSILRDKPNPNHCFEVIWDPPHREVKEEFRKKLRALIDKERPAHTKCYINLKFPEEELPELPSMVIGFSSVIGLCYIK
jgi:phage tail-like protein